MLARTLLKRFNQIFSMPVTQQPYPMLHRQKSFLKSMLNNKDFFACSAEQYHLSRREAQELRSIDSKLFTVSESQLYRQKDPVFSVHSLAAFDKARVRLSFVFERALRTKMVQISPMEPSIWSVPFECGWLRPYCVDAGYLLKNSYESLSALVLKFLIAGACFIIKRCRPTLNIVLVRTKVVQGRIPAAFPRAMRKAWPDLSMEV
jgi:hypothetical protein